MWRLTWRRVQPAIRSVPATPEILESPGENNMRRLRSAVEAGARRMGKPNSFPGGLSTRRILLGQKQRPVRVLDRVQGGLPEDSSRQQILRAVADDHQVRAPLVRIGKQPIFR